MKAIARPNAFSWYCDRCCSWNYFSSPRETDVCVECWTSVEIVPDIPHKWVCPYCYHEQENKAVEDNMMRCEKCDHLVALSDGTWEE